MAAAGGDTRKLPTALLRTVCGPRTPRLGRQPGTQQSAEDPALSGFPIETSEVRKAGLAALRQTPPGAECEPSPGDHGGAEGRHQRAPLGLHQRSLIDCEASEQEAGLVILTCGRCLVMVTRYLRPEVRASS